MDLEKIAHDVNVSVRKVRLIVAAMRRYGYLPPGDKLDDMKRVKMYLNQGQGLTVAQFVDLIEKPELIRSLGAKATAVRKEIAALGNPKACTLPAAVIGVVGAACKNDDMASGILAAWVKANMPEHSTTYHYFAVRIMLGIPADKRTMIARKLHRAFLAVCGRPDFAGWFHVVEVKGKRRTLYHRPK